jgi:hypothetical protein
MKHIRFTDAFNISKDYYPKPASKDLPEWYRETLSYRDSEKKPLPTGTASSTIKKCIPIFDALTSGYLLYSHCDVYVKKETLADGRKVYVYQYTDGPAIEIHESWQANKYPEIMLDNYTKEVQDIPKWMNPWVIKTPPGYSCIITQPVHRKSVFTIFTGIVDTDNYASSINFPFVFKDLNFEGIIPAGTPIAQVIPFKRDSWKLEFGNKKDVEEHLNILKYIHSKFFDAYKNKYWNKKEYK